MNYSLILTDGGMGDLIGELVAVDYCIRNNRNIKFQVWVPDYLHKFAIHVLPPKTKVQPFSLAAKKFDGKLPGRTTEWFKHGHTPMRTHPVDYGFHMLADKHIYNLRQKNYLQIRPDVINIKEFKLPKQYVCIGATAAEPCKAMSSQLIKEIAAYINAYGYTPVYLGKEENKTGFRDLKTKATTPSLPGGGINLINKTDMLQAAAIIHGARAFVGMDSGLVHLAGCTYTPIVAGYTLVDPVHIAPIRQNSQDYKFHAVEPEYNIPNRYFQSNNSFYLHDYRTFPGWEAVLADLTADKFISQLRTRL